MAKHPEKAEDPASNIPSALARLPKELQEKTFSYLDGGGQRQVLATGKAIRPGMDLGFRLATKLYVEQRDARSLPQILQDYVGNSRLKTVRFQAGRPVAAADLEALAERFPALEELVFNAGYTKDSAQTCLDDAALAALASFTQLRTAGLSHLRASDWGEFDPMLLAPLGAFQQLVDLDLSGNGWIKEEHLGFLNRLPWLKRLDLSGTACSGAFLKQLAPEASLEALNLQLCALEPDVLSSLAAHPNLTFLGLGEGYASLGDKDMPYIAALVHLRHLDLSGFRVQVTPAGIQQLGVLRSLRQLNLRQNMSLGRTGLAAVGAALPSLEELDLSRMVMVERRRFEPIDVTPLSQLSQLKKLTLRKSRLFTGGLMPLAGLEHLEYLDLTSSTVGAADITFLKGKPSLATLILDDVHPSDSELDALGALGSR